MVQFEALCVIDSSEILKYLFGFSNRKLLRNIRKTRILEILKSRRLLSVSDLECICTKLILSAGVLADPAERLDGNSLEVLSEVNSQILYGFVVYRVVNNTC